MKQDNGDCREGHQSIGDIDILWTEGLLEALVGTRGNCKQTTSKSNDCGVLDDSIKDQLRIFLAQLAYKCKGGAFHNLDHACQVFMAHDRMLKQLACGASSGGTHIKAWVKFTALLSALIRNVHPVGLGDQLSQLDNSKQHVAAINIYLHSLEDAWDLLMQDYFVGLRGSLRTDAAEWRHFKQLLVNLVLAADLSVHQRWAHRREPTDKMQLALALEQISVASQWTNTMQHWANYKQWNDRLYQEISNQVGTIISPTDWQKQSLALMDKGILPLTKQLALPQALGATGNELLIYAIDNRRDMAAAEVTEAAAGLAVTIKKLRCDDSWRSCTGSGWLTW